MGDPMKISNKDAQHYNWKEVCDGWYLAKNKEYTVISEKMPLKTAEDMHYHINSNQFFYVLSGKAEMIVAGEKVELFENEGIEIKKGIWYQMMNSSEAEVSFLVFSAPDSHGDRVTKE